MSNRSGFFIVLFICLQIFLHSQNKAGLTFAGGISFITSAKKTVTFYPQPSASVGFYYQRDFGKRSIFSAELLVSHIRGKEYEIVPEHILYGDTFTIAFSSNGWTTRDLTYLNLPLMYGMKFGKLEIFLGLQTSYLLYKQMKVNQVNTENGVDYPEKYTTHRVYVDQFDIGAVTKISYPITKYTRIFLNYYHGLNNIHGYNFYPLTNYIPLGYNPWNQKVRQLTLGLKFQLRSTSGAVDPIK